MLQLPPGFFAVCNRKTVFVLVSQQLVVFFIPSAVNFDEGNSIGFMWLTGLWNINAVESHETGIFHLKTQQNYHLRSRAGNLYISADIF
jgi:hypothetical protein